MEPLALLVLVMVILNFPECWRVLVTGEIPLLMVRVTGGEDGLVTLRTWSCIPSWPNVMSARHIAVVGFVKGWSPKVRLKVVLTP